ncbi:2-amino-4-hydroxy-6-hydroxymethyldihydropteridine diphosphokinase [Parapedobacter koreensis]|uniref:2-amino-4-hydroxy-6-hydroxymethyldihydropteridine pyrophosphokinase n=1 Tax=Parapedobacter koreensis TaxID=332977 RepID=A0A1H7RCU0_9SPHI|nr:2-amino-4-hydroxy-6-hydroxymethyldihydropteridine diphosphokinase [Parapedobacter koreensis]SEL58041.1 2-amino-4-hydroxy-6-hydroxymethyldihydropteridinediphosphokinase [Parapedobacter koreensis]
MSIPVVANAYLLLGTNMGDRITLLQQAYHEIAGDIGDIINMSSIYETAAWGNKDQPDYLNQVVAVATLLQPLPLLEKINAIEKKMGRQRIKKWEPRPIDIDILWYADQIINEAHLQVPHPHLPNRRFALMPLQEIAPLLIHPLSKKTVTEMLNHTPDHLPVHLYKHKHI